MRQVPYALPRTGRRARAREQRQPSFVMSLFHSARPSLLSLVLLLVFALVAPGCGKNKAEGEVKGPLDGREVSRTGQLTGTWMRITPGDYLGFEFNRDGKAVVTHHTHGLQGEAMTVDYSVREGGRVHFVTGGGFTQIFSAVVSGDVLELTPESGGKVGDPQRFRRVPDGKTLAVVLREHAAEIEAQRANRSQALRRFLQTEGLVIKRAQDNGPPLVVAITVEGTGPNLVGRGIVDPDPSRHDPLRPVQRVTIRGEFRPVNELEAAEKLVVQIEPIGRDSFARGWVEFQASGDPERPTLRGRGGFPQAVPGDLDLVLVKDASAHRRTEARLAEQREAARRAIAAVADPLGGRVLLTGTRIAAGRAPQPVELLLEREGEEPTFRGQVKVEGREVPVTATVDVVLGAGALYVNQGPGEQWRLQRADAKAPYKGPLRPTPRADFLGHGEVELTIARTWTEAQVKTERAAIDRFVSQEMRQPQVLHGAVARRRGSDVEYWPVWLELEVAEGDELKGQLWLIGQNVGLEVTGRRNGATLVFNTGKGLPNSTEGRSLAQQRWQITLASMDPQPRFEGTMSSNLDGGGPVALTPLAPGLVKQMREALLKATQAPAVRVTNLTISRRTEGSHFRFARGKTANRFTGDVVGADLTGSTRSQLPPGLFEAELTEMRGVPVLQLRVTGSPDPANRRMGSEFAYTLAAVVEEGEARLVGWGPPGSGNQTWLDLATEASLPEVSPEQTFRLAAHRAGAVIEPPKNPTPGDEVLVLIQVTERDLRAGSLHFANERYSHGDSIPRAALHAGLAQPGDMLVVRLTYDAPHTAPTIAVERNGTTSAARIYRTNNTVPTFRIERVELPDR